jgi:hypothetical protein
VGLVAGYLADLVFVVVGIEEVGQGKTCRHNDQQQPEKYQTQDFAERFHGRVLVVSRIGHMAGEYSAAGTRFGVASSAEGRQRYLPLCHRRLCLRVPGWRRKAQSGPRLRRLFRRLVHPLFSHTEAMGNFSHA